VSVLEVMTQLKYSGIYVQTQLLITEAL